MKTWEGTYSDARIPLISRLMIKHLAIVIEINRYPYLEKVLVMLLHNLSDLRETLLKTVKLILTSTETFKDKDKLVEYLKVTEKTTISNQ